MEYQTLKDGVWSKIDIKKLDDEIDKQQIYEAIDLLMDRTKPSKVSFVKTEN